MPPFSISAHFPLGFYQGKRPDGESRDPYPDVSRLHSALLHSAGKGSCAIQEGTQLVPSAESLTALRWLEMHPPNALHIPANVPCHRAELASFRSEGYFETERDKKARKNLNIRTALAGPCGWLWDDMPFDIAETLSQLIIDVSCLGESDSPVVLDVTELPPTHSLDEVNELEVKGHEQVRVPPEGSTDELEEFYSQAFRSKPTSAAADRVKLAKESTISPQNLRLKRTEYYAPLAQPRSESPWESVLVFPVPHPIPVHDRVAWCVAFHRMLASKMYTNAPPVVTGRYDESLPAPANRVAIHYVDGSLGTSNATGNQMVVMLPRGISDADQAMLRLALQGSLPVTCQGQRTNMRCAAEVRGDEFWAPVPENHRRVWSTTPAMVSEVRRQPDRGRRRWGLTKAVQLSVAHVFRDSLRWDSRDYWTRADSVESRGVHVLQAHLVKDSNVGRYAHTLPKHLVAQPINALVDLGELDTGRSIVAIGQARHLGGGLLIPINIPEAS